MNLSSMCDLLVNELKDLHSAETQLVKALPKMAKKASTASLKEAIESHLEETKGHVERLQQIADILECKLTGQKCKAMEGLVEEGSEMLSNKGEEAVIDAGIIAAAQRVEHYEIAAYGSARAMAQLLGHDDVVQLLQQTLDEEKAADKKLTDIVEEEVYPHAMESAQSDNEDQDEEETGAKKRQMHRVGAHK
jgi:ferritin-like metal-binding protein YciE